MEFQSSVVLTDDSRRMLTVDAAGALVPTTDRVAATLTVKDAASPGATGTVRWGDTVVFVGESVDARGRSTTLTSLPFSVQPVDGTSRGALPDKGEVVLFPTRSTAGKTVVDALIVTLRLLEPATPAPAPTPSPAPVPAPAPTPTPTPAPAPVSGGGGGGDDDMPFIGEIRMFAGSYAPRGWALCDGQLLTVSGHTSLFSILGTTYGGNGSTTFALPDLRGRVPMHAGPGPGLSPRQLGDVGGQESVTLTEMQLPGHTHAMIASDAAGTHTSPAGRVLAAHPASSPAYAPATAANVTVAPGAIGSTGGSIPHENMPPFGVVNYIIATEGIFPTRA